MWDPTDGHNNYYNNSSKIKIQVYLHNNLLLMGFTIVQRYIQKSSEYERDILMR